MGVGLTIVVDLSTYRDRVAPGSGVFWFHLHRVAIYPNADQAASAASVQLLFLAALMIFRAEKISEVFTEVARFGREVHGGVDETYGHFCPNHWHGLPLRLWLKRPACAFRAARLPVQRHRRRGRDASWRDGARSTGIGAEHINARGGTQSTNGRQRALRRWTTPIPQ